ncbi:DEHA2C14982p [Debaryomyces hansenii CBS767]|uniref:rRNA methyltransferase 1, mitochondrial n=1 Tax=Debaryomyces hansenii (strain ATCC 36239 / CBS 767 / BCRC 21394 / JCM 1990 / NBRC 0083 / IGC 2968) TaxID=284592 RepID=Q6BTY4_DEBHA|nr:mitochondrial rRNA methyltransferase [Debaryomyces hansenii CBS767]CAG86415.2 DEHA2C14982p [Debaryomyces hansenii CBS767]|eukprot:XP_458335.2 mitochondrial rRNA methyltransferase [Debaryomyces hansenii CBS767]
MLKTPIRRFSVISNVLNKNESNIKPVFKSHYSNEGAKHFDKNFPKQVKRKPWDDGEQTKDEFYMKKYGSISEKEREFLNQKVDRQRRARKERKDADRQYRKHEKEERFSRFGGNRDFRQAFKNPLSEYVYGTFPVMAALMANKRGSFNKLITHNPKESSGEIFKLAKRYGLRIDRKDSKNDLNVLSDNGVHNGIVLETKPLELPIISTLGECDPELGTYKVSIVNDLYNTEVQKSEPVVRNFSDESSSKYPLGIYLDGITDPQNIGAIVRSAYYLGADFIVVPDHETARLGPVANKASAGSLDLTSIYQTVDSLRFVESVKNNGWNVITTSAKPNHDELHDLKSKHEKVEEHLKNKFIEVDELSSMMAQSPILLIMGSEGAGVRTNLKLKSDYLVGLDKGRRLGVDIVDSLNVSVACGLLISKCFE